MVANAAFSLVQALYNIIGYFGLAKSIHFFILNGVSYLISAVSKLYLTLGAQQTKIDLVLKNKYR